MGDSLLDLANEAREWFEVNNVKMPLDTVMWQAASVRRKEIPPGMTTATLRRKGIKVSDLLAEITNSKSTSVVRNPITEENIVDIGFTWLSFTTHKEHKKVEVLCNNCESISILDYGTLARMRSRNDKYCMLCRDVGGKPKPIETYDKPSAKALSITESIITFKCFSCESTFTRGSSYSKGVYDVVCPTCNPDKIFGKPTLVGDILFPSKIEAAIFLSLLKIFDQSDIVRQYPYNLIFNTGTKHTADFYIPSLGLVIEATHVGTAISDRYMETRSWKLSLSPKVLFITDPREVEDIVRPYLKK